MGLTAPIFPIFYSQYIRIKYVVSSFMKTSAHNFDDQILKKYIPEEAYTILIVPMKNLLYRFVEFKEDDKKKKDAETKKQ